MEEIKKVLNDIPEEKKILSCNLDSNYQIPPYKDEDGNLYYKGNDGSIIKIFCGRLIDKRGKDIVEKLAYPRDIEGVIKPKQIVVVHDKPIGYVSEPVLGQIDEEYETSLGKNLRNNLFRISEKFSKLETIVKEAGPDIIFPHLLDERTIIIDKNSNPIIANYDNLQIGNQKTTRIAKENPYYGPNMSEKYYYAPYYSKEWDKKLLIEYFLLRTFGYQLPYRLEGEDLRDLVRVLGSDNMDEELFNKIKTVYSKKEKVPYIGTDIARIASDFRLVNDISSSYIARRLVKKR